MNLQTDSQNYIYLYSLENTLLSATEVPWPVTKTSFSYSPTLKNKFLTSSDVIRVYNLNCDTFALEIVDTLSETKNSFNGPVVTFDWSKTKPDLLGSCSIDTTCSIWNVEKKILTTQLIAHKKEVTDFTFSNDDKCFITSGGDGQVKLFDLRDLKTSFQIYQTSDDTAISGVSFNPNNSNLISVRTDNSPLIGVIDVRQTKKLYDITFHTKDLTCCSWSPYYMDLLASASTDGALATWMVKDKSEEKPYDVCYFDSAIYNMVWSPIESKKIVLLCANKIIIHSF